MMSKKFNYIEHAREVWKMYQTGIDYQNSSGLSKTIPMCVRFFEGKQWPDATDSTKNFPRPVVNITKMICRNKKAGILSNDTAIIYACDDAQKAKKFTNFGTYITKELNQKKLDRKAINDGCVKGTYVYHYYWDSDAIGKRGNMPGGIRCEIIDPLNILFANPNNDEEQSQEWIIIRSRLRVKTVKAMADSGVNKELIVSDNNESKYREKEQDDSSLVTVLTRYFRQDGEVYFEKTIKGTVINKPRPLHPNIKAVMHKLDEDNPNEEGFENEEDIDKPIAHLYPVAVGQYEPRDKCIFGIGEVEGIIPNQKAINSNLGLQLLNIQDVWGGKYVVLPNALRGQKITNNPGQVLVDYSGTGGGIKKITEQVYNDVPLKVLDTTSSLTRVVTGATEVMTGETIGANTSGAAILQLQSQALKPIEELQQAFWDTKVKCGRILEMFYKLYYEDVDFYYEEMNVGENGEEQVTRNPETFNGSEYIDTDFDVTVEVVAGAKGSEVSLVNALDNLLQQKQIDITTYFELYPHNALPNKTQIVSAIKQREQDQIFQLQNQMQQYEQQLQNAASIFEQEKTTIQNALNAIKENENLRKTIINLKQEFSQKIKQANEQIQLDNAKIQETTADATELARELDAVTRTGTGNAILNPNNQGQV